MWQEPFSKRMSLSEKEAFSFQPGQGLNAGRVVHKGPPFMHGIVDRRLGKRMEPAPTITQAERERVYSVEYDEQGTTTPAEGIPALGGT